MGSAKGKQENTLAACAKINLHLRVLNKRRDGFHNILSLMAQVGLADIITLTACEFTTDSEVSPEVEITVTGGGASEEIADVPSGNNLISKAASAFCKAAGTGGKFVFSLEKNIPVGAGLGGGSADAAAALTLLNANLHLPDDTLSKVASAVGADVPFLLQGGLAICTGIGDEIEPVSVADEMPYSVVLANNGVQINTGAAYATLGRGETFAEVAGIEAGLRMAAKRFAAGDVSASKEFFNDFEDTVFARHSAVADLKQAMISAGADFAIMSGTGSTIAGVFSNATVAESAVKFLQPNIKHVFLTSFVG